jgi:hypothetical protein
MTRRSNFIGTKILAALLVTCLLIVSCSSDEPKEKAESTSRTPTSQEAQIFSRALVVNYERQASSFRVTSTDAAQSITAAGTVEWNTTRVGLEYFDTATGTAPITSVRNNADVFETFDDLGPALVANGFEEKEWVKRSSLPKSFRNDAIAEFVLELASATPENPLLIRQDGTKVVGESTVNDEEVLIFERSGSVQYFVAEDSTLLKVKVRLEGFDEPVEITFSRVPPPAIVVPSDSEAYPLNEVENIYLAFRPSI